MGSRVGHIQIKALIIICALFALPFGVLAISDLQGGWIEEAVAMPLPDSNNIMAQFQFTIAATFGTSAGSTVSPAIWHLVQSNNFNSLELTLTRGSWRHFDSMFSSSLGQWTTIPPPGLELRVGYDAEDTRNTSQSFQSLGHSLSALVAASVPTLVNHGVVARPVIGWYGQGNAMKRSQVFGALPQEGPCSENIAAWLKLLPCRNAAGLTSLLSVDRVIGSPFLSLSLSIEKESSSKSDSIKFTLGMTIVRQNLKKDTISSQSINYMKLLRAAVGHSLEEGGDGNANIRACPAAAKSEIMVPFGAPSGKNSGQAETYIEPECTLMHSAAFSSDDGSTMQDSTGRSWKRCQLLMETSSNAGDSSIARDTEERRCSRKSNIYKLNVQSSMKRIDSQANLLSLGALVTVPTGDSKGAPGAALLHIMQVVPWEIALQWHTMQLSVNGRALSLKTSSYSSASPDVSVVWAQLQPSSPRKDAALIEVLIRLPQPSSNVSQNYDVMLSIGLRKGLLTVFDLPPDASRGLDVPAALVTLVPSSSTDILDVETSGSLIARVLDCDQTSAAGHVLQKRGSVHLINLPIPDASMPFNVVCFTSTAMAVTFGSVLNALLRPPKTQRGSGGEEDEEEGSSTRRAIKKRVLRMVVVLIVVGSTAVYMDKDLQRKVQAWLTVVGAAWPVAPGGHSTEL